MLLGQPLLSKRWKDLWTNIPCLNFQNDIRDSDDTVAYRNFVSRVLHLWKGAKIMRFSLTFKPEWSFPSDILDSWLLFAIEKHVEELSIYLHKSHIEYHVPRRLCFCPSIRKLTLFRCDLIIEEDLHWNQLDSLTLDSYFVYPWIENVVNQILCGSPRLKFLNLKVIECRDDLNIQSDSLKVLIISRLPAFESVPGKDEAILRIEAPNLETLEISEIPYTRCLLKVPSLISAYLGLRDLYEKGYGEPHRIILVKEMLSQVLPIIHHVQKFTLSDWCGKVLLKMKKDMLIQFPNAKFLKLYASAAGEILDVLEMFPELMILTLEQDRHSFTVPRFLKPDMAKVDTELKTNLSSPSVLHLRKVEISWFLHDMSSIFPAMKVLLENAHLLEKMVLRTISLWGNEQWLYLVEEKLLSIPRSSPTAEVII